MAADNSSNNPAPAAPAAPAQRAPTIVPTAAPAKSAVELASERARQTIAEHGTALPPGTNTDTGNVEDPQGRPIKHGEQPRSPVGNQGRFAKDGKKEVGLEAPNPRNASLEGKEEAPPAVRNEPQQPQTPQVDEDDAGEEESLEGAPAGDEGDQGDEQNGMVLRLPDPRRPGEEFELEVEDQATKEAIAYLRNGFMDGETIRAATEDLTEKYSRLEATQDQIIEDPAGFFLENMASLPEVAEHLALTILTQPNIWQRVKDRVLALADEKEFRTTAAEVKGQRYDIVNNLKGAAEERRAVRENFTQLQSAIGGLASPDMPEAEQTAFFREAMGAIKAYADKYDLVTVPIADVPVLLARVMQKHGINPVEAAARLENSRKPRGNKPVARAAARAAAPAQQPQGRKSGSQFVKGEQRRKMAARALPAGAGTPSTLGTLEAPKNADGSPMSVAQRVAWHREQLQKGNRLMTPGQRT